MRLLWSLSRIMRSSMIMRSHRLSVEVCKTWFESQWTPYRSGSQGMTERQNWHQGKFNFLKTQIRCKGLSKSSGFKSRPEEPVHSLEISMRSDTTQQPSVASPSVISQCSTVDQVMDEFSQMKTMLSFSVGPRQ